MADQQRTEVNWADLTRNAREALSLLGYPVPPCLPDEPDACGGNYTQHLASYLAALRAVISHHLLHLGAPPRMVRDITKRTAAVLHEDCRANGCQR